MVPRNTHFFKATACISKVKRIFMVTLALAFGAIFAMYSTSSKTEQNTLMPFNTLSERALSILSSRNLNQINSLLFRNMSGYNPESADSSNSDKSSKSGTKSILNLYSVVDKISVDEKKILEFPGMPDPCAEPRRDTGVEDVMCMEPPKFLQNYKNPCWYDNGVLRCLPYFYLFGVCKSGTSDLFKRMLLHPDLVANKGIFGKEVWFWTSKRLHITLQMGQKRPGMTLKEFTSQFYADKIENKIDSNGYHPLITGHGDPMDFWDRFKEEQIPQNTPGAEELLWTTPYAVKHVNPDVKLLLMLRDPINRLFSHYYNPRGGTSAKTFDDDVRASIPLWNECLSKHTIRHCIYNTELRKELKVPIYTSFYSVHLKEWLKVFPRSQIHIMRNEDSAADMGTTLKGLFKFLDVETPDDKLLSEMVSLPHFYESAGKEQAGPIFESTRKLLVDLYRPYTEELARMLGDERFAFKDASFG